MPQPTENSAVLFAARGLFKTYRAGTARCSASARVLQNLDLDLCRGDCVGIVGARASGKTTLVRCVAGLARADAGRIRWEGTARSRIVSLAPAALPFETVRDVLARNCVDPLLDPDELERTLPVLGLEGLLDSSQVALTTDERARLALAIGLAWLHPLLLLDGTADVIAARARPGVAECLRQYVQTGRAVLLTGRDAHAVDALATSQLTLSEGRLWPRGSHPSAQLSARVAEARPVSPRSPPTLR